MRSIQIPVSVPLNIYLALETEAVEKGVTVGALLRQRLQLPPAVLGRPPTAEDALDQKYLAEHAELKKQIAAMPPGPIGPLSRGVLDRASAVKSFLIRRKLLNPKTGKLFAEESATPASSPERADSDAKKTTKRKK